jgi:hypothetical protein
MATLQLEKQRNLVSDWVLMSEDAQDGAQSQPVVHPTLITIEAYVPASTHPRLCCTVNRPLTDGCAARTTATTTTTTTTNKRATRPASWWPTTSHSRSSWSRSRWLDRLSRSIHRSAHILPMHHHAQQAQPVQHQQLPLCHAAIQLLVFRTRITFHPVLAQYQLSRTVSKLFIPKPRKSAGTCAHHYEMPIVPIDPVCVCVCALVLVGCLKSSCNRSLSVRNAVRAHIRMRLLRSIALTNSV